MGKSFTTAAAFPTSLEHRINQAAAENGVQISSLRLKVVMERLLARLFTGPDPPWLLKGGDGERLANHGAEYPRRHRGVWIESFCREL
jgi:hypothetical protein